MILDPFDRNHSGNNLYIAVIHYQQMCAQLTGIFGHVQFRIVHRPRSQKHARMRTQIHKLIVNEL